jgi:phosphoserine phosphatase
MRVPRVLAVLGVAVAAALTTVVSAAGAPVTENAAAWCPRLPADPAWYGDNRDRLQQVIDDHCAKGRHDRPVAVFDWDNTVTKNDITDLAIAWALNHDQILRPADWADTSPWLTDEAVTTLTAACGTDVPVGAPLPTSTNTACTDEIFSIRESATLMNGAEAFAGEWNSRRTKPSYAWVPQLFAGHTEAEVTAIARASRAEALSAPVGATQLVGTHEIHAWARYYPQIRALIRTLHRAGFEVWIDSAGATAVTLAWTGGVGVDAGHVVAIRNRTDDHGRITTTIEGCGGEPDGHGEVIPYIEGKRCWLNQEAFGVTGPDAWQRQDPSRRPVIAAGDANTDVSMVEDATGAHLVVNRNQAEFMCKAYDDADGRWLINPMFIEPLPRKDTPYPCGTEAYINPDGTLGPVLREDGTVVPDQEDTVFG